MPATARLRARVPGGDSIRAHRGRTAPDVPAAPCRELVVFRDAPVKAGLVGTTRYPSVMAVRVERHGLGWRKTQLLASQAVPAPQYLVAFSGTQSAIAVRVHLRGRLVRPRPSKKRVDPRERIVARGAETPRRLRSPGKQSVRRVQFLGEILLFAPRSFDNRKRC